MNRKILESIISKHMQFDEHFNAYRCMDIYGNDVFISFQDLDCYLCITDDPSNECRGYGTSINYDAIKITQDQITFVDENIIVNLASANF